MIFGALAVNYGLSPAAALGMSAFVFAGSSQFVAANMVYGGASIPFIVLTTFVVNLRHALYAATLAPYVRHLAQPWLVLLGFWLTDESFLVVINRYQQPDVSSYKHWFYFGSALFMYTNWQAWTLIGIVARRSIENPSRLGLDFALVVTFIGMITPMMRARPALFAAIAAGFTAVSANGLENRLGLLVAALVGIAVGIVTERSLVSPHTDEGSGKPHQEDTPHEHA
jgi:4-azaleucine resistance transporter AzlC